MNHKDRKDREDEIVGYSFFEVFVVFVVHLSFPNPGSLRSQCLPLGGFLRTPALRVETYSWCILEGTFIAFRPE